MKDALLSSNILVVSSSFKYITLNSYRNITWNFYLQSFSPLFNYTTNFLLKSECWNDIKEQGYLCLYTQLLLMTRLKFSFFEFFLSLSIRSALDARAYACILSKFLFSIVDDRLSVGSKPKVLV